MRKIMGFTGGNGSPEGLQVGGSGYGEEWVKIRNDKGF
jgi:hypothetical protein